MATTLSFQRKAWLCGAVLLSSLPLLGQQPNVQYTPLHNVTLRGQVETRDGQVIPVGVTAALQTQEGIPLANRPVDSSGNFEFDGLAAGTYILTVKADNFQTFQQTYDFSDGWSFYHSVQIFLVPLDKTKVNLSTLPAMTDQAAPKSARKEFEKGARAWREKNSTEAREHLEKAVAAYSCYARAQSALAEVDIAEHKPGSAETRYKQAIHCDSTYMDAFYQLARLYMTENKPADSEAILREALRLSPRAWLLHYQLGIAQFAMGEYREAAKAFLTAQSLHPDMPAEFHAKLANTYLKTAEYARALAEMDTYLRLSPEGPYAASAKKISEILRRGGVAEAGPQAGAASPPKP
jgi:tetratricopeptide (TPR) repeat protein